MRRACRCTAVFWEPVLSASIGRISGTRVGVVAVVLFTAQDVFHFAGGGANCAWAKQKLAAMIKDDGVPEGVSPSAEGVPLRAWMVVGLMHMPEKPSLLASWMNAKRGSVGSKVCPGASRATASCQIIFNACTISRISNMSLCIVSDMAAREIESVCARERESARARACSKT